VYTVKEAAQITGLTEHAVRFYTDKGLVPGLKRDGNHNRLFDDGTINWLHGVKCLKASGMPIKAIKEYRRPRVPSGGMRPFRSATH